MHSPDESKTVAEHWLARFPRLSDLSDHALRQALEAIRPQHLLKPMTLFQDGDQAKHYLLVLRGSVRVQLTGANGREIVLYRVGGGESCVLTTSCLLSREPYPARGVVETDVECVSIPSNLFHRGLEISASFRDFVFDAYGQRLAEMIGLIQEVAFSRLEVRLARCLLREAGEDGLVCRTHQGLAAELGSAREVVSRQLKDMERKGLIRLCRGQVQVLDVEALAAITIPGQAPEGLPGNG